MTGRFPRPAPLRTPLAALVLGGFVLIAAPAAGLDRIGFNTPGASEELEASLRNYSLLLEAQRDGITDPQELFAIAQAEYGRLVAGLYAAGHYAGVVNVRIDGQEASEMSPLAIPQRIGEISVTVEPGPAFTFSRAEVAPLAPDTTLPEDFAPGQRARSPVIRDAAQAAVGGWRSEGHALASPEEPDIVADHRDASLDARLYIAPGPRLTFGEMQVRGNERMRSDRMREIAGFPTGEVYNPEDVQTAAQRLRRTGTFTSVAMSEAEEAGAGDTLDVTTTVVEAPLRRVGFGGEFDTQEGLRVSAFWLHRNLLGGAERLRVEGEVGRIGASNGGRDYRFSARFSRPATFTPDTTLSFGGRAETVDARDFDAVRLGLDATVTHIFSDTLTGDAGIAYLFERTDDAQGRTDRSTVSLPVGLTWDRRDNELDASTGTYLEARLTPFVGLSGTDTGGRLRVDARGYYGMGSDNRLVFAGRVQLGTVVGAGIQRTPRDYLFYSGGGGTVRGQPFRSLGVTQPCPGGPADCTISSGGRSLGVASAELRGKVTENIGLVGFADAGLVGSGSFGSDADWHAGAGVGIRYQTGIGPIRADLAAPVRGDTGRGLQLYIGIGQAF